MGGDGDDQFYVGAGGGDNLITGGKGADQFWIANDLLPKAANTITDFEIGKDVIGIARLGLEFSSLSQTETEGGLLLAVSGTNLAVLQGITAPLKLAVSRLPK